MRVLLVSPVVPWPPDSGGRLRTFKLLKYLAPHAEVRLFAVRQPGVDAAALEELSAICAEVRLFERGDAGALSRLTRARPERWFHAPRLRAALAAELALERTDLVHLDEPSLVQALPWPCAVPALVHHHKLDRELHASLPGAGLRKGLESLKLARLERLAARRTGDHVLCSREDAELLGARHPGLRCHVVESGFDPDYLAPCLRPPRRERATLLFLGTLSYGPNVDALRFLAHEILPRVRALRPDAVLEVVGRDPGPEVLALASDAVRILGPAEDVRPALERAAALVAPLRIGGGTRLKLVEALAMATPVVASPIAAEGLALEEGLHLRLASGAHATARALLEVLEDPDGAAAMARRGRTRVLERYTWDTLSLRLLECWREIAGKCAGDAGLSGRTAAPTSPAAAAASGAPPALRSGARAPAAGP